MCDIAAMSDANKRSSGQNPAVSPSEVADGAETPEELAHKPTRAMTPPNLASSEFLPAPTDALPGSVIADRYRVLRQLGRGGMGVVYLTEHVILEKKFALKMLSAEFARSSPDLVQRFLQEAKAASKIGHENIVDVVDFGTMPSGSTFFVMEYLEGRDLAEQLHAKGPFEFERARALGLQLASALAAAHGKGIVHRDMKAENVILVQRGGHEIVKILDFGIARMTTIEQGDARLTRAGVVLGTPEYISPEQARGDPADHRVDIYALGCILYEMLTGTTPFFAETVMGVLSKHLFEQPEPVRKRNPRVRLLDDGEAVVMKALAKDPNQRFQSMVEFGEALAACEPVPKEGALPGPAAAPKRHATKQGIFGDPVVAITQALERSDGKAAFEAAERAVSAAGGLDAPTLAGQTALLVKAYEARIGDLAAVLTVAELPEELNPRAAFLLTRIDGMSSVEDVVDISGMPRVEAVRLIALLIEQGALSLQ
jgi:predicted Ser/Thr protein kinase